MVRRARKPYLEPRGTSHVRQLTILAARVVELERQLAERSAQLRREQARTADLAARVPVDVRHARRLIKRLEVL